MSGAASFSSDFTRRDMFENSFMRTRLSPSDHGIDDRQNGPAKLGNRIMDTGRNNVFLMPVNKSARLKLLEFPAQDTGCWFGPKVAAGDTASKLTVARLAFAQLPDDPHFVFAANEPIEGDGRA